jgi:hypothetical protein
LQKEPKSDRAALLTDVPVTGTIEGGGGFTGTLTATHINIDPVSRQLTLSGILNGTATNAAGDVIDITNQAFSTSMTLNRPIAAAQAGIFQPAAQATCGILFLDLGPLHLDLLGLTIDLNEVVLAVNAVTGPGKLLGNLLCALLGILDLPGAFVAITQILGTVNNILAGLSNPGVGGVAWLVPSTIARGIGVLAST